MARAGFGGCATRFGWLGGAIATASIRQARHDLRAAGLHPRAGAGALPYSGQSGETVPIKALALALAVLLLASQAYALDDEWRWYDTALLAGALAVTEIDREQTEWFLARPNRYYEANPVLYGHPTSANVDTAVALAAGAAALTAWLLPEPYREMLLVGWIATEGSVVHYNSAVHQTPAPLLGVNLHW